MTRRESSFGAAVERTIASLSRSLPPFRGKRRLLNLLYPREGPRCRPLTGVVETRGGFKLHYDTSSYLEWELFFLGEEEPETNDLLRHTVRPGWSCFDVGANIGFMSLVMARAVGPSGRVHAFEPNLAVSRRLEANIALNGCENVQVEKVCLGPVARDVDFYLPPAGVSNVGQSSLYLDQHPVLGESVQKITAKMVPLDHYVASRALTSVDLIKIDVEGGELGVLGGATQTLERFRPTLVFEANGVTQAMAGSNIGELFEAIEGQGYTLLRWNPASRGWETFSPEERSRAERQPNYEANVLASPREPAPVRSRRG